MATENYLNYRSATRSRRGTEGVARSLQEQRNQQDYQGLMLISEKRSKSTDEAVAATGKYVLARARGTSTADSLRLYGEAAEVGHAGACFELARLCLQGNSVKNVPKNLNLAQYYANKGIAAQDRKDFDTPQHSQKYWAGELEALSKIIPAVRNMARR